MSDDVIKFAAAFATQVREQSKWVSVATLPELGKYVIAWMPKYKATWVVSRLENHRGDWEWWEGEYFYAKEDVTHWAPLPAPPETTEQEER